MSQEKDWNEIFAQRKKERDLERSQTLSEAKAAAARTEKEPFNARRFKKLYARLNSDDVNELTPWETLLREAEYDYYVTETDKMSLEEFVKHLKWLEGWG
ncbi:MAG: hypothetical protein JRH20_16225 [Deltaproteobacteria bacterium]|nr:hypothetical protein [Deltaproteobacteria bacterium]